MMIAILLSLECLSSAAATIDQGRVRLVCEPPEGVCGQLLYVDPAADFSHSRYLDWPDN